MFKRFQILVVIAVSFVILAVPVQALIAEGTGEQAVPAEKPTLFKSLKRVPEFTGIKTTESTTEETVARKKKLEQQQKLLLQSEEKEKWEAFQNKLQTERLATEGQDPQCATADATLKRQTTALDKNFVKSSSSYKQASQRAHNTVKIARVYLGEEAATAEQMLKLFDEKIALFEAQSLTFQSQKIVTQQFACKTARPKFNVELKKLKETSTMNSKSVSDIMSYYNQNLRPEITRLGQKLKEMNISQAPVQPSASPVVQPL